MARLLLQPGTIGPIRLRNRLVRAATSETMGGPDGEVTDELVDLYETLARHGVGLIVTGHLYCHPRGQYAVRQTGIHDDVLIPGLRRLAEAVHRHGAKIFAELSHAGSQSRVPENTPLAPSSVPNALTGRMVAEATPAQIDEAVAAFGTAARRAAEAGFDGVHLHGGTGYLISEFSSPLTNRRADAWGGSPENRDRFSLALVREVKAQLPPAMALTMRIGFADAMSGGLQVVESTARAARVVELGVDAIEVSVNAIDRRGGSARPYVAVSGRRALQDLLFHRLFAPPIPEAYFLDFARALRRSVNTTIILVGGLRRVETMEAILRAGEADFVALARPFIREPDLVQRIAQGHGGQVACTSCNLCLIHEGHHSLRCWRTPRTRLLEHAMYRLRGGLRKPLAPLRG
jgi:2,4-dienoyl-CoA reductase-like NADH-dependent reductase (Old Yellow Enzyme family)